MKHTWVNLHSVLGCTGVNLCSQLHLAVGTLGTLGTLYLGSLGQTKTLATHLSVLESGVLQLVYLVFSQVPKSGELALQC